ncbi:MAG TPA: hypothetical protein VJN64_11745 [Terriglobales bacterium]|nr:hypothetical protein [Terriglobales bacterium]
MVVRPDGTQYQMCPICGGTGEATDPGLYFAYAVDITLNANQVSQAIISVTDYAFRALFLTAKSTGTFTSQLMDGKNKRPFSNENIQNVNAWGTAQNPFPLPIPYEFSVRDQILINVTDTSGVQNVINFTIHGTEVQS